MQAHVLDLDDRGPAHTEGTLKEYLPGLDLGVQWLAPLRVLVPGSTVLALSREYGPQHVAAILAKAGACKVERVAAAEAVALLSAATIVTPRPSGTPAPSGLDWHLDRTHAQLAWDLLGGRDSIDWTGVRVGHIDTGYAEHPALGFGTGQPSWVLTDLGRTFYAEGAGDNDPGPGGGVDPLRYDFDGHGTRTASTICGWAPQAAPRPFFGIAPKVPLVPVRIANHVAINYAQSQFGQAVDYLVDVAQVQVISLSMGMLPVLIGKHVRRAVDKAYEAGVIMVCAAGNWVPFVVAPANLSRTLAIAGVTERLQPWSGSSHGHQVDISGPAQGVRRAEMRDGPPRYRDDGDGTSYSTALVAGTAALWLAYRRHDGLAARYPQPWQRVEAFGRLLRERAQLPPPPLPWDPTGGFGSGVLDAAAVLQADLPPPATAPDDPAA